MGYPIQSPLQISDFDHLADALMDVCAKVKEHCGTKLAGRELAGSYMMESE